MLKWVSSFLLLLAAPMFAQTGAIQGSCDLGGAKALLSGMASTNYQQGNVPSCTITVYLTGTASLATIYADGSSTPLSNPFTATTAAYAKPGSWIFWAAYNQGYDVVASGGVPPNTYPTPVPLCTDCFPNQQLAVISGVSSITAGQGLNVNQPTGAVTVACDTASSSQIGCSKADNATVIITGGTLSTVPGTNLAIKHNGTLVTDQAVLNFLDSPPSPPSGNAAVAFTTDSGGGLGGSVPIPLASSSLEMAVIPPAVGQYAVLLPASCNTTGTTGNPAHASCASDSSGASLLIDTTVGTLNQGDAFANFTFSLPSYIVQANVTDVWAFGVSASSGFMIIYPRCSSTLPGVQGPIFVAPNTYTYWPLQQVTNKFPTVPTVSSITCTVEIGGSLPDEAGPASISRVGLIVYYTGTAPPTDSNVQVQAPLNYIPNQLSLSLPFGLAVDAASTNTYVAMVPAYQSAQNPTQSAPPAGATVTLLVSHSSTSTTPSLNINGQGAATIVGPKRGALAAGDIAANFPAQLVYDGAKWELQNPQVSGATGLKVLTVATLPSTPAANTIYPISDGSTSTDCASGSGSNRVLCYYNGSTWAAF